MKQIQQQKFVIAVAAMAVLGGGGVAWMAHARQGAGQASASVQTQPQDLLQAIPVPTGNTHTDQAIAKGRARAQQKPDDFHGWNWLGDALMQKVRETGDLSGYGLAERCYERALTIDPESTDALVGMAWVTSDRHEFDKSLEWAHKALKITPQDAAAYGLIGDAEVEQGDYDAAFKDYQKMLDLRPDISSYSRGAHLLWMAGNMRKASWLMTQAIKAGGPYSENAAWCRAQLATMLFQQGALLSAEQVIDEALKQTPNNRHCLLVKGKLQTARGKYTDAIATYRLALAIANEHGPHAALYDLYMQIGDKASADKEAEEIERLHTANHANGVHDHMQMALFYADHDRNLPDALRLAEAHRSSQNVNDADILAWCYYKNNRLAEAKEAITRALRLHSPDSRILFHAGMIYSRLNDRPEAQKYLYQALSLNQHFDLRDSLTATEMLRTLPSHRG